MRRGFYIKKLDEETYKAIKAAAVKRGVPVYRIINEALALYLNLQDSLAVETEEEANNRVYESLLGDPKYEGKWAAICGGRLIAVTDTWEEALKKLRQTLKKQPAAHGIVAKIGGRAEQVEILGSTMEML